MLKGEHVVISSNSALAMAELVSRSSGPRHLCRRWRLDARLRCRKFDFVHDALEGLKAAQPAKVTTKGASKLG